jgi:hypothetical protein
VTTREILIILRIFNGNSQTIFSDVTINGKQAKKSVQKFVFKYSTMITLILTSHYVSNLMLATTASSPLFFFSKSYLVDSLISLDSLAVKNVMNMSKN